MIQKMSDERKIGFLNSNNEDTNNQEVNKEAKDTTENLKNVVNNQKSKKLNNKDNGYMTSKHISSARTGNIKEERGPNKHIKMESSNLLWDSDRISNLSKINDSKTNTKAEKERILDNKRVAEQKRMDELVEGLKSTDLTKDSSISPNSPLSGSNYKNPVSNISIFDTSEFERLAEKTRGEEIVEENRKKRAQKDESWKNSGKCKSSRDVTNRLFDSLFDKE